jgi:hypothetical protein
MRLKQFKPPRFQIQIASGKLRQHPERRASLAETIALEDYFKLVGRERIDGRMKLIASLGGFFIILALRAQPLQAQGGAAAEPSMPIAASAVRIDATSGNSISLAPSSAQDSIPFGNGFHI